MAMLDVKNISKSFGATRVLEDISFSLEQGETVAVIGASGSGKTTLLRCLTYLEKADKGTVAINGQTVFDAASQHKLTDSELRDRRLQGHRLRSRQHRSSQRRYRQDRRL